MSETLREQLLGYLLGALDDDEQREVERRIASNPAWRDELEKLQTTLEPLAASCQDEDPPAGLAERTVGFVAGHIEACRSHVACTARWAGMSAGQTRYRFSMADAVVAAGVCLAAAMLFFPAISNSRSLSRLTQCQNNLRQLSIALADYSEKSGAGYFPPVPPAGPRAFAGIYGPILLDEGYLLDARVLICPIAPKSAEEAALSIPSLQEIDSADPRRLIALRRLAGRDYGYILGFVTDGQYHATRNLGRAHFALMADAPDPSSDGYRSANHGTRGQNLLFEDGHLEYIVESAAANRTLDHPFQNHFGVLEAGVDEDDAVVAASYVPPFFRNVRRAPNGF